MSRIHTVPGGKVIQGYGGPIQWLKESFGGRKIARITPRLGFYGRLLRR